MAPTVVHPGRPVDREKRPRAGPVERRSDLVSRVRYCNTLPDIPSDPKFINYPFSSNRYVQYKPTSLEKNYKYEVLTEHDLGVIIDLISPDAYAVLPEMTIHPTDEKLLEDDILMPQDAKRSRHHHVNVSWLRKTEYISTEMTRYQPQTMDKIEATVGFATRRKAQQEEDNTYTDRESQLEAIEKTFEDVKKPIKAHYSKPGVVAVEELCVFPDFEMWKYPCAQVIFDSDPAPIGRPVPAQIEEMSQAMIRGVMDESGEQFVAYFLPSEDTLIKRKRDKDEGLEYKDEEEYDYSMAREYNWNVKNKASKGYEENYFLVVRNEGVFYNELETRVRLSKRRLKQGQQPNNSRLVVIHRPLIAQEHKTQRYRERMLEPPCEDEEEDEEEEEEMLPVDNDDVASRGSRSRSRSGSRSGSGSRSRSHSGSRSRSHSGSPHSKAGSARSKSVSRSRSRSGSRSVSKARSHSRSTSRSRSRSRSKSQTKIKSRSRSGSSESRSRSRSKSKDKSRASSRSKSRSLSKSRSRSPSKSRSQSPSKSRSQSPSKSRSQSPSKSRSQSPSKSRSPSPSKSRSHSPSKSRSRSQSRSRSHSRSSSRSRSKVKSITPSRSRSKSFTPGRSSRSRSRSPSKSPRSIGSSSPAHSERSSASGSSGKRSRSRSLSPEEKPKKKIKP